MQRDLTRGPIGRDLLLFAVPLILGDLLQQLYNVADTWVVGRFLGGDALAAGVHYLRIEGACYLGIGILFLLYGYYRAIDRPGMSVLLTVASLGTRVALAYALAPLPGFGVTAIWAAVPIGWALADAIGIGWYLRRIRLNQNTT